MPLGIPLPRVVADVGPGGGIVTAMRGINALTNENLDNQLKAIESQYYGPKTEANIKYQNALTGAVPSEIAQRQAQIAYQNALTKAVPSQIAQREAQTQHQNFLTQNPLIGQAGVLGQIGGANFLQGHPEYASSLGTPQELANLVMQGARTGITEKGALGDYFNKRTQAYNYMSLPIDQKSSLLAQASGLGIDPTKATQLLMSGKSIEDLAKEKGLDPSNLPDPIYPATKTSVAQIQRRQQALNEINTLNPLLTNAISPYSRRVVGYSPNQIADAISGDNEDSQAKFLAARALMPEMSALRLKAMQGTVGIEALREVTNASMGNIKVFESLVPPKVYKKSNEYIDKWINQAVNSANKVGLQPGRTNQNKSNDNVHVNEKTYNPQTGRLE